MLYFFWEKLKEAPGQERVWPCFPVILFAKLADCSFRVESISARLPGCNIQQAVYYTDDLKKAKLWRLFTAKHSFHFPLVLPAEHWEPLLTGRLKSTSAKYHFLQLTEPLLSSTFHVSALPIPQASHPSIASSSAFSPALSVDSQGSGTPVIMCRSPTGKPAISHADIDGI